MALSLSYAAGGRCFDVGGEVVKREETDREALGAKVHGFYLAVLAGEITDLVCFFDGAGGKGVRVFKTGVAFAGFGTFLLPR